MGSEMCIRDRAIHSSSQPPTLLMYATLSQLVVPDKRSSHTATTATIALASRARATRSRRRPRTRPPLVARARRAARAHMLHMMDRTRLIAHAQRVLAGLSKTVATKLRASQNRHARPARASPSTAVLHTIFNAVHALSSTSATTRARKVVPTRRQLIAPLALRSLCARKVSTNLRSQPRHPIVCAARIWRSVLRATTRPQTPQLRRTASARYGVRAVQGSA